MFPANDRGSSSGVSWWRFWFASGVFMLLLVGGWAIYAAIPKSQPNSKSSAEIPKNVGFTQKLDAAIPLDLKFVNANGETKPLSSITADGKPIILNLVYFQCPMLCQMSIDGLVRTLKTMSLRVGEDFHVVTISFDPREGPEQAAAAKRTIVSRYGGDGAGWHCLTGTQEAIDRLATAVGFGFEYDEQSGQYAHAAGVVVLTPAGRTSRYISGVGYAARDLRLSLVEASANQIGSVTDQAMLLCFRYDPRTGKYGLAITRAIQFAGLLTVAAVVGSIGFAVRREQSVRARSAESA